jgi:hypothetical protein
MSTYQMLEHHLKKQLAISSPETADESSLTREFQSDKSAWATIPRIAIVENCLCNLSVRFLSKMPASKIRLDFFRIILFSICRL